MVDLKKLKSLTENLTVLYVEDSEILLKRMGIFLNNIFKEVHTASNGQEGLMMYQEHQPDIVMTDLNMPVMDGHTMIMNLKKIDPKASIIIVSAYSDTNNLLKSIHLGVADFIPKPMDSKLLQGVLYKVARSLTKDQINPTKTQEIKAVSEELDGVVDEMIMKRLEMIYKSHLSIEFLNHYKGVPITDKGTIQSITNNTITVSVPFFQGLAVKFEKSTIIQSELLDNDIKADLEKVGYNESLTLTNLHTIKDSFKRRKQLTIQPDHLFKATLKQNNVLVPLETHYISSDLLIVKFNQNLHNLKESDLIDLQVSIQVPAKFGRLKEEVFELNGEVFSIDLEKEITILFEIKEKAKEILEHYIQERRSDLITEFKQIKKV